MILSSLTFVMDHDELGPTPDTDLFIDMLFDSGIVKEVTGPLINGAIAIKTEHLELVKKHPEYSIQTLVRFQQFKLEEVIAKFKAIQTYPANSTGGKE